MTYNYYTAIDFAMDAYFQRWVLTRDAEAVHYWQSWLELHPEKQAVIEEARDLLLAQNFKEDEWPRERMIAVQERIKKSLAAAGPYQALAVPKEKNKPEYLWSSWKPDWNPRWMAIAASVILLVSVLLPLYFFGQEEEVFATAYGETQSLVLPDGSEVILNANSRLRFVKDWQQKEARQVWLEGEAFFKVSKLISPSGKEAIKFIVHLEDLDVEVVGTAFNVNHRSGKIEVSLDEGIVDLKMTGGERLRMKPGDMIAYSAETQRLDKSSVNLEKVTAWRKHQMILDGQPLSELALLIKNYYGVDVRFSSPELADRKIRTVLPTDKLETVLTTLEMMYDVQSERKGNEILMK